MINNPKARVDRYLDMTSTPTFWTDPAANAPEPGLGGSDWYVTYRGDALGYVYSTWDAEGGVHFRVRDRYRRTVTQLGVETPMRFETRADAARYLMELHGIRVPDDFTYDQHKGPRGGGVERIDRRY